MFSGCWVDILSYLSIFIPILLLSVLHFKGEHKICSTKACRNFSRDLLSSIDKKISPCEDFYEHVCGRWLKNKNTSSDTDSFTILQDKIGKQIKNVLENSWNKKTNSINHRVIRSKSLSVKWTVEMFQKCLAVSKYEKHQISNQLELFHERWFELFPDRNLVWPLSEKHYKELVHKPQMNVLDLYAKFHYTFGFGLLISLSQTSIDWNQETIMLDLDISLFHDVVDVGHLNYSILKTDSLPLLEEVTTLESDLLDIKMNDHDQEGSLLELSRLNNQTGLDWVRFMNYLAELSNASVTRKWTSEDIVGVNPFNSFVNVFKHIGDLKNKKIFYNFLYKNAFFNAIYYLFIDGKDTCVNIFSQPRFPLIYAVSRIWIDSAMKSGTKFKAIEMVSEVKIAVVEILNQNKWLDETARYHAINKIHSIVEEIAFPEWIIDDDELDYFNGMFGYPIHRQIPETFYECMIRLERIEIHRLFNLIHQTTNLKYNNMLPLSNNAEYRAWKNTIHIAGAILNKPFFDPQLPFYLNFASMGLIIGHEILHSLDSEGSAYDKIGRQKNWLKNSAKKFEKYAKCFVDEYSSVRDPFTHMNLNGEATLAENIADNGGLRVSYQAFKNLLQKYRLSLEPVPIVKGLDGFSFEQLFFMSYAKAWCSKRTISQTVETIKYDEHSPPRYRVNIVLRNFEQFAKAFGCSNSSKMVAGKKCVLW